MPSGGVRVEGLTKLARDLTALGLDADDLKGAFGPISERAAHLASGFAPRRTGRLAGTVRGNRAKNKAVVTAGRGRRVSYAGPINYGWRARNIQPSLFMQRADLAMRPVALDLLERELNRAIERRGLA